MITETATLHTKARRVVVFSRLAAGLVGLVFLVAAFSKASDPGATSAVIVHFAPELRWHRSMVVSSVGAIVGLEALLGYSLLLRNRGVFRAIAGGVLVLFSVVLVALSIDETAPRCGCFGGAAALMSARHEALFGVVRNLGLLGLLVIAGGRPSWPRSTE